MRNMVCSKALKRAACGAVLGNASGGVSGCDLEVNSASCSFVSRFGQIVTIVTVCAVLAYPAAGLGAAGVGVKNARCAAPAWAYFLKVAC
jgi:hypothetical protein